MAKRIRLFHKKDFLNRPFMGEDASIFSEVVVSKAGYSHGNIKIRDCSAVVTLDIDLSNPEDYRNTLYKINVMIDHLTKLHECLDINYEMLTKEIKERKKKYNGLDLS